MDSLRATLSSNTRSLTTKARATAIRNLDERFPPSQRSQLATSVQSWASEHPRLAYLLTTLLLLTTPPLTLFLALSTTILLTSLATAIFLALCFAGLCISTAFLVLIPVLVIAVLNALGLFVVGLGVWWLLRRFAESETPVPFGEPLLGWVRDVSSDAAQGKERGGEKKQVVGMVDGAVGVNGDMEGSSNMFGIRNQEGQTVKGGEDEDDIEGMPESVARILREIRRGNGGGSAGVKA